MTSIANRSPISLPDRLPPLQGGDRLSADEFERRYRAMPDATKAELIDGVVYMAPPVNDESHGFPHFDLVSCLGLYRMATPGVVGGDNSTLRLGPRNQPQPDALLRIIPECGGRVRRDADGYLVAAPDLIAEVAASSVSYDLGPKLEMYRRFGAREYLVWRVYDVAIDWFVLRGDEFQPLVPGADGVYRSEVFPGLWLNADALLRSDGAALLQTAQEGIASPEHAAFVERLRLARG